MAPIGSKVVITTAIEKTIDITATITIKSGSSRTISEINADAIEQMNEHFKTMLEDWGKMGSWNNATYSLVLYYNRVVTILNNIDGVEVANDVYVNGQTVNIGFIENKDWQQIPVLNSLVLTQGS